MQADYEQLGFHKQVFNSSDFHNAQIQANWLTNLSFAAHPKP